MGKRHSGSLQGGRTEAVSMHRGCLQRPQGLLTPSSAQPPVLPEGLSPIRAQGVGLQDGKDARRRDCAWGCGPQQIVQAVCPQSSPSGTLLPIRRPLTHRGSLL